MQPSAAGGLHRNLNANLAGKITISMDDQTKRPEFKYKGPKEIEDRVTVLYNYKAQRNDELDLVKGDELLVLVKENENWWMGELVKNQMQGYFPANYVIDLNENETGPPKHFVPIPSKFIFMIYNPVKIENIVLVIMLHLSNQSCKLNLQKKFKKWVFVLSTPLYRFNTH